MGTVFFSVGAGVGHVSVRREAVEGVTLVVQQRAWPVDRRPSMPSRASSDARTSRPSCGPHAAQVSDRLLTHSC